MGIVRTAAKVGVARNIANNAVEKNQRMHDERATQEQPQQAAPVQETESVEAKMEQLKSLLDKQLITQEEYDVKRQELLSQL